MDAPRDDGLTSVVVTTRNEESDLERCLESIRRQSYPRVEIVVVDNNSSDGTKGIAARLADAVIDYGPERSAQRNAGARRAAGDYLFFVDADMELDPAVVAQAVERAEAGAAAVVVPETSVGEGIWSRAKALERSCYEGDATIEAARFFRREVFERFDGYDETLTGPEDWDLPARIAASERIDRTTARIVHHEGRLTLGGLARKKFYYGRSFGRYIRRHPRLASKQLNVLRPAFVRHRARLAQTPALTLAMVVMKLVEFGAGGIGLASATLQRHRDV